jgi:hypothetical protein
LAGRLQRLWSTVGRWIEFLGESKKMDEYRRVKKEKLIKREKGSVL